MKETISEASLHLISKFISANIGLDFSKARWTDLKRGIISASRDCDAKDPESYIQRIISSPLTKSGIETLASHLTIGETYFFRNINVFHALQTHILPELISKRRQSSKSLRIWSAACATGEEPYSLAILLSKMIPDLSDWNITILATDINPRFLKKALSGVYTSWSFRNTPRWVKFGYFQETEDHYQVVPQIREMVRFSHLNLMDNCYPSLTNNTNAMDLIFCRNVLMYFSQQHRNQVLGRMYRSNVDGGQLLVSPGEMPLKFDSKYNTVHLDGAIFYRKIKRQAPSEKEYMATQTVSIPEAPIDYPKNLTQETLLPDNMDLVDKTIFERPKDSLGSTGSPVHHPTYQKSKELFDGGHYPEAAISLNELLSTDQSNVDAMILLARTYANEGDLAQAAQWCKQAISTDKLNPTFYYLLSTIMVEQGLTERAIAALKKVLYLDHNFVLGYFTLGNIHRRLGKLKESKKNFDTAASLLTAMQKDDIVPESDGISAGRLIEIVNFSSSREIINE